MDLRSVRKVFQNDTKVEENEPSLQTKVKRRLNICLSGGDDNRSGSGCSIYVVPGRLRRGNEEAFTPRVISIGPVHHGNEHLQAMEANKSRYVSGFLDRLPYHLSDFIDVARKWEKRARDSYQNVLKFSSDEFVTMILVDGIFIVELLMRYAYENMREKNDIFQKKWVQIELHHDMILLENQLPFFILEDLFSIASTHLDLKGSLRDLAYNYFNFDKSIYPIREVNREINHILDLIYSQLMPSTPPSSPSSPSPTYTSKSQEEKFSFENTRSAADLHLAGVKFGQSDYCPRLNINFINGKLEVPFLRIDERTEPLFGNLIAYEQCHHDESIISSYIILMDILINTPNDVDVLVRSKIIEYSLDNSQEVCSLFNNLYKRTTMDSRHFYHESLCKMLNKYSKDPWHQLQAGCYRSIKIFKQDYLSSPWKFISVIAAVILLALTVVQTVCSFLSLKQ